MAGYLVQGNHGNTGNFEVVSPAPLGGLAHWWRDNDAGGYPWIGPQFFGAGQVDAAALVFSNFEGGHLEVVAREGGRLAHYWRNRNGPWDWSDPTVFAHGVSGSPSLIQSHHGQRGSFEVIAPLAAGGLGHWWRDNDAAGFPWHGPTAFGSGSFSAVAVIQSNFGSGHLEVVARTGHQLVHFWRDDDGSWQWHGPTLVGGGVSGSPALIQSRHGQKGSFEVVAPLTSGGLAHWWRDNDAGDLPWHGPTAFGVGHARDVGLIAGSYGHLEVVARVADRLEHYWRDDDGTWQWHGPLPVGDLSIRCDAATGGQSRVPYHSGIVAIHLALLKTGRAVLFAFSDRDAHHAVSMVLNPTTGGLAAPEAHHTPHVFCSGHSFLPDGRLLVAGGHLAHVASVHQFEPSEHSGHWRTLPSMQHGRWYPTCTTLPDGNVFIIAGSAGGPVAPDVPVNNTYEIFEPTHHGGTLRPEVRLPNPFSRHFPQSFKTIDLYPFVYVLPSGQLFVHSRNTTRFLNPASGDWDPAQIRTQHPFSRTYPGAGTSVLLPLRPRSRYRASVMVIGGGGADREHLAHDTPATNTAEILHLDDRPLAWRFTRNPMQRARVMPDAVLLPDGTVLVVGGSRRGRADHATAPVLDIELFDPERETWTLLCPMRVPRLYHSTAMLLPDGRVLMAGKDALFNPDPFNYPEHRAELFSPPYLFRGAQPRIAHAPSELRYDAPLTIESPDAAGITSVVLIKNGSVTHSFNMEQRFVELAIVARETGTLTVQGPPNARLAPPGHYLLFLVNDDHVPSVAPVVRLR